MLFRHRLKRVATATAAALLLATSTPALSAATGTPPSEPVDPPQATTAPLVIGQVDELADQVDDLSIEVEGIEKFVNALLTPIAILATILAAGGALGVVFSVREQRRAGQLHELTVGGEIASQRRSEQSYGSFLEQSQTTLSLVNDTLQLAKEANDRAAQSMESKVQSRIDAIEERAQSLMLDVFGEREFELIVNDHRRRDELHDIASEVRSLEGYLSLQDINLPPNTKFVKAIDQFLLDDTESALQALRLASQDSTVGELQRFVEYWLGYILTTVGAYDEAISRLRHDEIDLKEDDAEYFQLERIIAETEFFLIAQENHQRETASQGKPKVTPPRDRFKLVAKLLKRLEKLAKDLEKSEGKNAKQHTRLEIARTRADIYEWVAYDPRHLDDPLKKTPIEKATRVLSKHPKLQKVVKPADVISSPAWKEMKEPNVFRAWALMQARAICEEQEKRNLDVEFALAECLFKLRKKGKADSAFESAEHALHQEFGQLHEKRRTASIHESVLICHSRLLQLRSDDDKQQRAETRQVVRASKDALDVVRDMRQNRVTIFSQIQRRNVTQKEFTDEINEIVNQGKDKNR